MRGRAPGQLIIQYTDKCNATCPQCDMRMSADFKRSTLAYDTAQRSIDPAAANGVMALSITGGEPLLYLKDVSALLRRAHDGGIPFTRTGTNGFLLANFASAGFEHRVARLAQTLVDARLYTFWISIGSADPVVHEAMRGLPGAIEGIKRSLPIFHAHGIYPSVNLGINRNLSGPECPRYPNPQDTYDFFRHGFRRFYQMVIDMGFTIANCCYPMSVPADGSDAGLTAVYQATAGSAIVDFSREERVEIYRALYDTIPEYRGRIRIFTPRTSLLSLMRQHTVGDERVAACRGGNDYFFVDAQRGHAFPCGYRGTEDLGPYWEMALDQLPATPPCRKCDWECWRDPSELAAPALMAATRPWDLAARASADPAYLKHWVQDLRYLHACNYFSARTQPDYARMARFAAAARA